MVDDPKELIGMSELCFKVNIDQAQDLPQQLCHNTFVTYQFKFMPSVIFQTDEANGQNRNPKFNYEKMHVIDDITEAIAEELKEGSISFQIYAYPPMAGNAVINDGGAALKRKMTKKKMERGEDIDEEESRMLGLEVKSQ